MADELDIIFPTSGSGTPYAIIRRESDGYVWDATNTVFEAWSDGSITDYDVALTSQGGDYWTGDFPTDITGSGYYLIDYRVRTGGSPTTSDQQYPGERILWGGYAADDPSGDDLVDISRVKEFLGISGSADDDKLNTLIDAVSRGIEKWCDRIFHSASYTHYFDGRSDFHRGYLPLRQYPVTEITRCATRPEIVLIVKNTATTTNQRAVVSLSSTALKLSRTASGTTTTNSLALATYTTIAALSDAIDAVGSGWDGQVSGSATADYGLWPSADLKYIQGAVNARSETGGARLYLYTQELNEYTINDESGLLCGFFPRGHQNIEVKYTAGYSTIPDDLQQGATLAVAALFHQSKLDPNLKSEKIGDYAYVMKDGGMSTDLDSPIYSEARFFLTPYKRLRILCD
jgi:hypothetical protein